MSMIQIQDSFGEQSISVKTGEKEFIHPLIDPLAYCHGLARRWCMMPSPSPSGSQPPTNSSTTSPVFILLPLWFH